MDPIWKRLPEHLVDKICNLVPKVWVPNYRLLDDIRTEAWMLERVHREMSEALGNYTWDIIALDLELLSDAPRPIGTREMVARELWADMSHEMKIVYTIR